MSDRPSKAWVDKFVAAAAKYHYAADRAPVRVAQRLYDRWMRLYREGQERWPHINFDDGLPGAVQVWLSENPLRGPGVDW